MSQRPDGEIRIEYGVVPFKGGFLPLVRENGHVITDSWRHAAFGRADALEMARQRATERSQKYVGDWDIELKAIEGGAS